VEFSRRYPGVSFDLNLTSDTIDLIADNIDVAIRFGVPGDSSLTMRSLGTIQHGIYASPKYLKTYGTPLSPQDLKQHQSIRLSHATKANYDHIGREGHIEQIAMHARFLSNNLSLIRNFALADLGVAIMPAPMAKEALASGSLVRLLPEWKFDPTPVLALTPTRMLPARSRVFIDFLVSQVEQLFGN
jgi:DNA-binding transcriptional LysR family regulator